MSVPKFYGHTQFPRNVSTPLVWIRIVKIARIGRGKHQKAWKQKKSGKSIIISNLLHGLLALHWSLSSCSSLHTCTHTHRQTHTHTHRQTDGLPQTSLAHAHRGHNFVPSYNVIIIIVLQDAGDYHGDKTDLEVRAHNSSEHWLCPCTAIRMTLHSSALPLNGIYVCMHAQWSRNRGGQGASGPPNFRTRGAWPPTMSNYSFTVTCFILKIGFRSNIFHRSGPPNLSTVPTPLMHAAIIFVVDS